MMTESVSGRACWERLSAMPCIAVRQRFSGLLATGVRFVARLYSCHWQTMRIIWVCSGRSSEEAITRLEMKSSSAPRPVADPRPWRWEGRPGSRAQHKVSVTLGYHCFYRHAAMLHHEWLFDGERLWHDENINALYLYSDWWLHIPVFTIFSCPSTINAYIFRFLTIYG